jgi:hypothetical protein
MPMKSEGDALAEVEGRLISTFSGLPHSQVRDAVGQAYSSFQHSRIRDFVPLLVERRARAQLAGMSSAGAATAGL